jgi:hypothetical protein
MSWAGVTRHNLRELLITRSQLQQLAAVVAALHSERPPMR